MRNIAEDLERVASMSPKTLVLAVDDEEDNLKILENHLRGAGCTPILCDNGDDALNVLKAKADAIDVILLDKMMPGMNGIDFMEAMKRDPKISYIPVIMQTASADKESILEGIKAGVFYYLTKPFDEEMLMSLVNSAVASSKMHKDLKNRLKKNKSALGCVNESRFVFRTLQEAKDLSSFVANLFPDPEKVVLGLSEIMINAVEHGNLQIGYNRKTELLNGGVWMEEIEKRQKDPKNSGKEVQVVFQRRDGEAFVTIKDEGEGFDWKQYLDISSTRAYDNHGRGIALANHISFDELEYLGCGNAVKCSVKIPPA